MSKLYGYLAAIIAGAFAVVGIFLSGRSAGKDSVNLDNAKYQTEKITDAYKALAEAEKEGMEVEDDAIKKANNNNFSGFNNKL